MEEKDPKGVAEEDFIEQFEELKTDAGIDQINDENPLGKDDSEFAQETYQN
jgi:hypothetical protein